LVAGAAVGITKSIIKKNQAKKLIKANKTPQLLRDLGFKSQALREAESQVKGFKKDLAKRTAIGAGVGAISGHLTGVYGRKGVGRIATNLKEPYSYDVTPMIGTNKPMDMIKAVIKDKPLYTIDKNNPGEVGREVLYRAMFGLKPREKLVGDWKKYIDKNKKGIYQYKGALKDENLYRPYGHSTMGAYVRNVGRKGKSVHYFDLWDFALGKNEKLDSNINKLRYVVDKITLPPIQSGRIRSKRVQAE
jgi:hypothetical protein